MGAAPKKRVTPRLGSEAGVSLPEVLVTILILAFSIVPIANGMSTSKRTTLDAQRREVAVHQAQREIEKMRTSPYGSLKLTAAPVSASGFNEPNAKVVSGAGGSDLLLPAGVSSTGDREKLVTEATDPTSSDISATVVQGPSQVSVGSLSVKVYRYVTWRDESCTDSGRDPCAGTQDAKRLLVAAVPLKSDGSNGLPYWMSSVVVDPELAL